jgi:hypothetical protein
MWEESMAQVAREQEVLEARVGEAEKRRKATKRALREVIESGIPIAEPPVEETLVEEQLADDREKEDEEGEFEDAATKLPPVVPKSPTLKTLRRKPTVIVDLSESESEEEDEFFDAVDAGHVEVSELPVEETKPETQDIVVSGGLDISPSFKGYENGIRKRLKMDADDRPKISLWVSALNTAKSTMLTTSRVF